MARFSGIPDLPEGIGQEWAPALISSLKQNVELLAGLRGEQDRASAAVLRGDVDVNRLPPANLRNIDYEPYEITAEGKGFNIEGELVAGLDDYAKLIGDVANINVNTQRLANDLTRLANDVDAIRRTLDALTAQLR